MLTGLVGGRKRRRSCLWWGEKAFAFSIEKTKGIYLSDLISSLFPPLFSMESEGIHLSDVLPLHVSVCYKTSSLIVEEIHI